MVLFVEKGNMSDWLKKLVLLVEKVCNESEIETLVTVFHILEINSVRIFFILFIILIIFNHHHCCNCHHESIILVKRIIARPSKGDHPSRAPLTVSLTVK